ncbi:MAG: hypothetical protein RR338_05840, partial [Clostridia bacterium]
MTKSEERLKALAGLFPATAPLFAVGGFVRDRLLNLPCHDLDICSQLDVYTVKTLLKTSDFVVQDRNLRMGTVIITAKNFSAEYTTFRTDSYLEGSGKHSPEEVKFTSNMLLDSLRRDFKCNAVYLNVLSGEFVDLLGGIGDIKNGIISAVDS